MRFGLQNPKEFNDLGNGIIYAHLFETTKRNDVRKIMAKEITIASSDVNESSAKSEGSLVLGTGLIVASMILVPALAMRLGLGASLTGALRIALMKASSKATHGGNDESGAASAGFSCH